MKTLADYIASVQADEASSDLDSKLRDWQSEICHAIMMCDSRCMTNTVARLRKVELEISQMRKEISKNR